MEIGSNSAAGRTAGGGCTSTPSPGGGRTGGGGLGELGCLGAVAEVATLAWGCSPGASIVEEDPGLPLDVRIRIGLFWTRFRVEGALGGASIARALMHEFLGCPDASATAVRLRAFSSGIVAKVTLRVSSFLRVSASSWIGGIAIGCALGMRIALSCCRRRSSSHGGTTAPTPQSEDHHSYLSPGPRLQRVPSRHSYQ